MVEKVKRLSITESTLKKLFAYSGNQCALPDCDEPLVDKSGTMIGKVAHISAAKKNGARFVSTMTNEKRRAFGNLFIVCGRHHDIIDDKSNEKKYPEDLLRKYKKAHESRFKSAERQLIKQFVDTTQTMKPTYPKNLKGLAKALGTHEIAGHADEIKGVRKFISKLKELPHDQRAFALKLAERMRRHKVDELPVEDVTGAFQIGSTALKRHMKLLEHWGLGSIDEGSEYQQYVVTLSSRNPGGNPWIEILDFCKATKHTPEELIYELNFGLYDN